MAARAIGALMVIAGAITGGARMDTRVGPAFVLKPNPPQAGSDVEVIYTGPDADGVSYRIGDGSWVDPKIRDNRFVIPGRDLTAGKTLYVTDANGKPTSDLCVTIEPKLLPSLGGQP